MGGMTGIGQRMPRQFGSAILEVQVENLSQHNVSLDGESLLSGIEWTKKYSIQVLRGIVHTNHPIQINSTTILHTTEQTQNTIIKPHQSLVMVYSGENLKPGQKTLIEYTPSLNADDAIRSALRQHRFFTKIFHVPKVDAEVIRYLPEQGTITGYCHQIFPLNLR